MRKGLTCNIDEDCPASINGTYAKCVCGWNSDRQKYCDLLPGDEEWK